MRSCRVRLGDVEGSIITTIEGLSATSDHPVQKAWVELQVPQCGYCHSGQIMQASAFLTENVNPSDDEIDVAMRGNLCRCMTYIRVRKAVKLAAEIKSGGKL